MMAAEANKRKGAQHWLVTISQVQQLSRTIKSRAGSSGNRRPWATIYPSTISKV